MFLYQKLINRSTLRQGFQIPVEFHHPQKARPGGMPQHGEMRGMKVVIDDSIVHKAKPTFDREQQAFSFPNGVVKRVKMDKYLSF